MAAEYVATESEAVKTRKVGFVKLNIGMALSATAIAALGQLYLQQGEWDGTQLLPREWVAEATRSHVSNAGESNPDWAQGYGFQFWMARHGYRGDGAYGQFSVVLPEHDVVLALTGQSLDMQAVLDAAWTHLLPAFGTDTIRVGDAAADGGDGASALHAEDVRGTGRHGVVTLPLQEVGPVEPGGGHVEDHLAVTGLGVGQVVDGQDLGATGPVGEYGAHVLDASRGRSPAQTVSSTSSSSRSSS